MLRIKNPALSVLSIVVFITLALPQASSASAADFCTTPVYAGNPTLDPSNERLNAAIAQLQAQDVDVHVIVEDTYGGVSYDKWLGKAMEECPNWYDQTTDDLQPRTLILFIATEERGLDSHLGAGLTAKISESEAAYVRDNLMVPELRATNGTDTTEAMIAGLNGFYDLLTQVQTPPQQQPSSGGSQKDPIDIPWETIGFILVFAAIVALLSFLFYLLVRFMQERRRKAQELQDYIDETNRLESEAREICAPYIVENGYDEAKASAQLVLGTAHEDESTELAKLVTSCDALYAEMVNALNELNDLTPASDEGSWNERRSFVAPLMDYGKAVKANVERMKAEADSYNQLMLDSKPRLEKANARSAELLDSLKALEAQGLKTESVHTPLDEANRNILAAESAFNKGRFKQGHTALDEANNWLATVEDKAEKLPLLASELKALAGKLTRKLAGLRTKQTKTEEEYQRLVDEYGRMNLEPVNGFGSHADSLLDEAEALIPSIEAKVEKDVQDYTAAEDAAERSGVLLTQAESLYQGVTDLGERLRNARERNAALLRSIEEKLQEAVRYCNSVQSDAGVDEIQALNALKPQLVSLSEAARDPHADFIAINKSLKELGDDIDSQSQSAEQDYLNAEQQRQKIQEAEEDLDRKISETERYIQNNRSDVEDRRLRELRDLRGRSRGDGLGYAEHLAILIALRDSVADVHRGCRSDVDDAVRARHTSYSSSYSSSSSGHSSFGSSFGSSSGHSSFGGFGGGHSSSGHSSW